LRPSFAGACRPPDCSRGGRGRQRRQGSAPAGRCAC
jgi:hypothetical protein